MSAYLSHAIRWITRTATFLPNAECRDPLRSDLRRASGILAVIALQFGFMQADGADLIFSQYVDTESGTTPKGVEVWNVSGSTIDFSSTTLVIEKGSNGGAPASDFTLTEGTLASNAVLVIGTSDMTPDHVKGFTFNGDDALVLTLGGVTNDVIGLPGSDPGSAWSSNGVSTADQNIQLKEGITAGDTDGWTDPSERFETVSTTPSGAGGLDGFGFAPGEAGGNDPEVVATGTADHLLTTNGTASVSTSVDVSGAYLTADITGSAPAGFELSTDDATWSNEVSFTQSGGSASGTLYIRLSASAAIATYSSNVTLTSTGATDVDVPVTGTVTLAAPVTQPASSVEARTFTANWGAVSGATGYRIDVYAKGEASTNSTLIISQYVDTDSGITPKGIELFNVSGVTIDFSVTELVVEKGVNGGVPAADFTLSSGTLDSGEVMVVGTTDISTYLDSTYGAGIVQFHDKAFTFSGNDALVLTLGGVTNDVFGNPGEDAVWSGSGVSTDAQNISLLADILNGDTDGWTDPSLRFETISDTPSAAGGLAGFGEAPFALDDFIEQNTEVVGGSTTSFPVTGLEKNTTYYYRVRATANGVKSTWSDTRSITTKQANPFVLIVR